MELYTKDYPRWLRAQYTPVRPLGKDGRIVTGSDEHIALTRSAAQEGIVLVKNDGTLPLDRGQKIALFGIAQCDYVRGGTGAGVVRCAFEVTPYEGLLQKDAEGKLELFKPLSRLYCEDLQAQRERASTDGFELPQAWSFRQSTHFTDVEYFCGRAQEPTIPDALLEQAKAFTDTAFVFISRNSGEFYDRTLEEYRLSEAEKALIETVQANFRRVVAVVNSGGQIEAGWLEDPRINAAFLIFTPGQTGGLALADLVCGDANPSGKLVDSFARSYGDYPSSQSFNEDMYYVNYTEDIFVGYRYFETIPGAAEKVVFPFGYGLSYTDFARKLLSAEESGGVVTVRAEVTNTGKMAGKEVLQLYHGAPQGKLGKAAKSLIAFAKTRLLAPGESQTLTLCFRVENMASYDDVGLLQKSAYVLEGGEYPVYLGGSVRDAERVYTYRVDEPFRVTRQLSERCVCTALPKKLRADGAYEQLPAKPFRRQVYNYKHYEPASARCGEDYPGKGNIRLEDVLDGKATLDQFIAQLDDVTLAELVGGVTNTGCACTSGFGGKPRWGIPAVMTADAPAGLRCDAETGIRATCFPAATTMACTWNTELLEQEGEAIALELKENNMYAWLGPALNIHRDPLNGRNFEYFSEDPLIAGKMAAAISRGAQKHRISACPKHFAANNKESYRKNNDSVVTERALREIYLKGFEICVRESDPKTIMSSYNYINGVRTSENHDLLNGILRDEWGFKGMVMTDWGGYGRHNVEIMAGNDMKMPGGDVRAVLSCLWDQYMTRGQLEQAVRNLLKLLLWYEGEDDWEK